MSDLDKTYSREWYREHRQYADEYRAVADALDWLFGPGGSVVDVGCGIGLVLARLEELGWDVMGLEGSFNARLEADVRVFEGDLRQELPQDRLGGSFGLALCFEVAEHIAEQHADMLVRNVCSLAHGPIVFTSAPPGQGGHDHVNEQPASYWLAKFSAHNLVIDERRTAILKHAFTIACPRMVWLPRNVMVLHHKE